MNGVLLTATGQQHLAEAHLCIRSIRAISDLPITLLTDRPADETVHVERIEQPTFSWDDKSRWIGRLPYDRTLYLDTDTLILRPDALEVFDLLDHFEIALAHAPMRSRLAMDDVPACFPEFNSGVIALRNSAIVRNVLSRWRAGYAEMKRRGVRPDIGVRLGDQPSLRRVLYESRPRIATLPPEYNYRDSANARIGHSRDIRILHDRDIQPKGLKSDGSVNWQEIQSWFSKR